MASLAPSAFADGAFKTVRVGFFAFDGYHMQDENGVRSGYGYDILQHIAGYAGLRYEYIGYDKSWSEMQDMLENGEIDILTSAQITEDRLRRFAFSDTNIGVSAAILTVRSGDTRYYTDEYAKWNGIRVGLIPGNSRNDSLAAFAAEQGFAYEPIYFDDTDELVAALTKGELVDAILTSNLRRTKGETVVAQFASSPFYIMLRKDDAELKAKINRAIARMDACEPGIRTMLMNKHYASGDNAEIILSVEERKFIEDLKDTTFTALINPDRAPYVYMEDGALTGIAYEAVREIIRRSGLNVEFLKARDAEEYLSLVSSGKPNIRVEIADSYNSAEANGYWLTNSFLTVPMARLARTDARSFSTAAEPESRDFADDYERLLADMGFTPTFYPSLKETVDAVLHREQDVAFLPMDTAILAVRDDVTNRLEAAEVFGNETSYAIGVCHSQDPLLFSILNKATTCYTDSDADALRQKFGVNQERPFTLIGYMYKYPMHIIIGVATLLVLALLLVVLISTHRRRRREQELMREERRRNQLLSDALEKAEKADAAKSQFLSRVSHEMRTPLNAIIGFIELAKDASPEKAADYLASSDIAAKQLLNVINDVLDMSSIESGKLKIALAPFNFRHLISSITNMYGVQCRQKGITFETKITAPIDDWLVGDEMRVNQILINLLGNAVKFTAQGGVCLTISEIANGEKKVFLRFRVSDTGCGMTQDMKERLFRPFEQESASTAKRYGGSGLGLSIVKNLIGMMEGSIQVESEPDKGTTFTVDLPFSRNELRQNSDLPDKVSKLRVLAVDDEASELEYISLVLTRIGVRYTCVPGGEEALVELAKADAENDAYNVCLVDWRMPGPDGVETTSMIRKKYGKEVVVIVVSAYDFQQAGESARDAGANMFLSKPIFQSSLFDLFMTLTGGGIAAVGEEKKSWDFSGKRVLVAEDNSLNQIVVKAYLAKSNLVCDIAENGKIATDMFLASPPGYYDAILMDIQMPVMDGFEATRAIRASAHPEAQTIQIIAQTADAFNEDIAKALSAGMNAHVAKPIKPDILGQALYRAFGGAESARRTSFRL